MKIPFEPSRSFVYKASRYEILPKIAELARSYGDRPFLLRDLSRQVLSQEYSSEQLEIPLKKAESDKCEKISTIFNFYIPFLAVKLEFFNRIGGGLFQNISLEEEIAEVEDVGVDEDSDLSGIIYAYSFPTLHRETGDFPIKIGLTTKEDAQPRIDQQCRSACCFEFPVLLTQWKVERVGAVEKAIHATLEARGKRRDAPGVEWFNSNVAEIQQAISFIQPQAKVIANANS